MRFTRFERAGDRRGFTLVELAIVLTISSILIGVAVPRIQSTFHQRDVNGARDRVLLMAARARAQAMEQATTVQFQLRAGEGRARIVQGGTTVESYDFDETGVEVTSAVGDVVMCYTARGFAAEPCSTHLYAPARVEFSRSGYTSALQVWQLGQLRKL
jgi:prepilin-type N-terminal cleavage/methylation domain-containing protein